MARDVRCARLLPLVAEPDGLGYAVGLRGLLQRPFCRAVVLGVSCGAHKEQVRGLLTGFWGGGMVPGRFWTLYAWERSIVLLISTEREDYR